MDEVVAAYGEAVAVAGYLPHGHLGVGNLEAGGDGCRTSVDGVEAVGVHVVGQARAAADAGDDGGAVRGHAEGGHGLVEGVENGVVAASGTPAHALSVFIVGCCVCLVFHFVQVSLDVYSATIFSTASTSSPTRKGWPCTLLMRRMLMPGKWHCSQSAIMPELSSATITRL